MKYPPSPRTVLIVDDEPCVLRTLELILSGVGYAVLTADNAGAALHAARSRSEPIDLLLADVILPGASGPALAADFARIHPETRVLYMAGLPDSPEVMEGVISRGQPFLPKPFRPRVLLESIGRVLEGRPCGIMDPNSGWTPAAALSSLKTRAAQ